MMMNDYYEYQKQLESDFGEKSIVFMMVGSFYETYEFNGCGKASDISPLMNIVLTKRNKQKELSSNNPWMCGFPSYCLKKYIDMLVKDHSYTIGIVDQIDEEQTSFHQKKSSRVKKRALDRIYGPSIPYEYDFMENESDNNNIQQIIEKKGLMLCEICFEKQNPVSRQSQYHLSCVMIDLGIGTVQISESSFQTVSDLMRQLKKWWYEFSVVECVQLGSIKYVHIQDDHQEIRFHHISTPDSKFSLLQFQQKILETIYQMPQDQVIQNLHLERFPVLVKLLVFGFDFLYRQSPLLTRKLGLPIQIEKNDGVVLDLHVFYELDILSKTHFRKQTHSSLKEMSLLRILDKTKTTMGSRLFRQMCFHPISDITELNHRYDNIERHLLDSEHLEHIRKTLEFVGDLEIAFRTIQLQKATPPSIARFLQSISHASKIYPWIQPVYLDASQLWNIDDLKYGGLFEKSFYIQNTISFPDTTELKHELDQLSFILQGSVVKFESGTDAHVYLSKLKYRKLKDQISHLKLNGLLGTIHVDEYKQGYQISTDKINCMKYRIVKQGMEARQELRSLFQNDVYQLFVTEHGKSIEKVIHQLKQLDVETTMASFIKVNGYCRPKLVEKESSSLLAKDMRHPILEFVHTDEKFISNDVSLNDDISGYLVYGLNSAGKSTLLRATGLCVFLAQVGMYVPCTEFVLTPFTRILTKITNMDDMYEKQSTFMFEMSELKHILRYANPQALVLCDELTSGTETLSATGILTSSILRCIDNNCRFMMTTHLHTLSEFPEITENPKLHICHFKVHVDGHVIRYDRQLENGMGDSIYGVEIVNAIGFDDAFVNQAFTFRNRMLKTKNIFDDSSAKRSRYNRKLIMDQCSQCGATDHLHTHHIIPQKESDESGMIANRFHKNKLFNLQILCQSCHQKEHK